MRRPEELMEVAWLMLSHSAMIQHALTTGASAVGDPDSASESASAVAHPGIGWMCRLTRQLSQLADQQHVQARVPNRYHLLNLVRANSSAHVTI